MRVRLLLFSILLTLIALKGAAVYAQQAPGGVAPTEEERRKQFLKAREEIRTSPPVKPANPSPAPKPKPRKDPTPTPAAAELPATPKPAPSPVATAKPAAPAKDTPAATPKPEVNPAPAAKPKASPVTPSPQPKAVTPAPAPPAPAPMSVTPAPVTIEKSGYEESKNLQPAGGFGWFTRWKYLSKSVRAEIDRAPVQQRRWRYIVVHNSGTRQGNAKAFDYYHLHVRHMQNGLAYQFVIGNGTSSGNGEVEIGNRWKRQINGGHVHSDYLNNIALGICLVGDFNHEKPTNQQLLSLDELIRYLRNRVGKIDRQWAIVKAHREINPPRWPTDCPGDQFPYAWLHKNFDQ